MAVHILLNPSAGKGRALKESPRVEKLFTAAQIDFQLHVTESEAHLRQLVKRFNKENNQLVGAGGDSTLTIMINELKKAGQKSPLAMIGLGSQDDIIKSLGEGTAEAAIQALQGRPKAIDLAILKSRGKAITVFTGQANIGLGTFVNRYVAEKTAHAGLSKNWLTLWGLLGAYRAVKSRAIPVRLRLDWGEFSIEGNYQVALCSKIRYWSGGALFVPGAKPDDGQLHLVLIKACSFGRLLRLYQQARTGRHLKAPEVDYLRAGRFTISSGQPFQIQVDGEILPGQYSNIDIEVLARAIQFFY